MSKATPTVSDSAPTGIIGAASLPSARSPDHSGVSNEEPRAHRNPPVALGGQRWRFTISRAEQIGDLDEELAAVVDEGVACADEVVAGIARESSGFRCQASTRKFANAGPNLSCFFAI